jgi:hypothetical protein
MVHPHGGADVMVAVALRRDLQRDAVPVDAVVAADLAGFLDAQDVFERSPGIADEGRALFGRRHRKAGVVLGHEVLSEIAVGGLDGGDLGQSQLRRQPHLQGLEGPLHAAARLGRIGRNMGDPELRQRPADLGRLRFVDPGLRRGRLLPLAFGVWK